MASSLVLWMVLGLRAGRREHSATRGSGSGSDLVAAAKEEAAHRHDCFTITQASASSSGPSRSADGARSSLTDTWSPFAGVTAGGERLRSDDGRGGGRPAGARAGKPIHNPDRYV